MVKTELITKMISWKFIDKSKHRVSIATIHAPTAKKKSISPGTKNSSKKKTNPIINHITGG